MFIIFAIIALCMGSVPWAIGWMLCYLIFERK